MSVKRLLDCTPSELTRYTKAELLDAIAGSEGRVLACETIGLTPPLLVDVTNAEYAASLSADILLLNMFDVQHPVINEEEISLEDGILHHQENVDLLPANIELSA